MKIPGRNNGARLRIHLVDVVLRCGDVYILHIIRITRVYQWLGEDLFCHAPISTGKRGLEELTELRAAHYRWVHVVVASLKLEIELKLIEVSECILLVTSTSVVATPCYRVGEAQSGDLRGEKTKSQESVFNRHNVCKFGELHRYGAFDRGQKDFEGEMEEDR